MAASDGEAREYPWHADIRATTFWVGKIFFAAALDGSQEYSTYDAAGLDVPRRRIVTTQGVVSWRWLAAGSARCSTDYD
jgi:hypothetical protein